MTVVAEMGAVCPQPRTTEGGGRPAEAGQRRRRGSQREHGPADTLSPDVCPLQL